MWHGFIGQRIAATNKTLHRSGMVLLVAALALCAYGAKTFINVKRGSAHGDELILEYIVVGALVLFGLWMFFLSKRRTEMPERHPLCKALSQYGPLYSVVPQIDSDVAAGTSSFNSVTFSRNWIISCWLTQVAVMRRDEIIWAYKKRTKHSVNFIPTGSSYSLVLRDARGKLLELSNSEQLVDGYLASLAEQTPWVIFGYDRKLEKLYKKQLQSFAQTVSDRRTTMQAAKS